MFIPLRDNNYGRHRAPVFVTLILALNVIVWFLQLQGGEAFTYALSTVPYEITHGVDLASTVRISVGNETVPIKLYPSPNPIYLTVLTAMFMHGSWLHIIGNMLYLWIFADQIEDRLGHLRFLLFYVLCGVAATAAHIVTEPSSLVPSLGASGAIAGVLGAYLITHPQNNVQVLMWRTVIVLPAYIVLGFWIVLQFLGQAQTAAGSGGGVAYMAHIGGFVAGIILLPLLTPGRGRRLRS